MVILVGVWAGPTATLAQVGVFSLAMAAFFLVSEKPPWRFNWPLIMPVAAIAGIPLTIGFVGLDGLLGRTSQVNGLCLAADGKAMDLQMLRMVFARNA